jgi:Uma2 family endonuclease
MQWSDVIKHPQLQNLPFKIELNKFGKVLMSPVSNHHGRIQGRLSALLWNTLPKGEIITECSVNTSEGVKVADIAWASSAFIAEYGYSTPYNKAPELCVEIVSASHFKQEMAKQEMAQKIELYLAQGACEVWILYENKEVEVFSSAGQQQDSRFSSGLVAQALAAIKG